MSVGRVYERARNKLATKAAKILIDKCRLIVGEDEYQDTPCELSGNPGNMDGVPYRISLPWGSPAVIGAAVVVDAIPGRPQLTLQLVGPMDSSTALWQDWSATSGPAFGRVDVGL
jgi:hypothetical protein